MKPMLSGLPREHVLLAGGALLLAIALSLAIFTIIVVRALYLHKHLRNHSYPLGWGLKPRPKGLLPTKDHPWQLYELGLVRGGWTALMAFPLSVAVQLLLRWANELLEIEQSGMPLSLVLAIRLGWIVAQVAITHGVVVLLARTRTREHASMLAAPATPADQASPVTAPVQYDPAQTAWYPTEPFIPAWYPAEPVVPAGQHDPSHHPTWQQYPSPSAQLPPWKLQQTPGGVPR